MSLKFTSQLVWMKKLSDIKIKTLFVQDLSLIKKKKKPLLVQRQKYKYQNGVNFHLKCFPVGDLYTLR